MNNRYRAEDEENLKEESNENTEEEIKETLDEIKDDVESIEKEELKILITIVKKKR